MDDKKQIYVTNQTEKLKSGTIDRRQFVTGLLAAGFVLPSALTMADQAYAMTPKKGGTYRLGSGHGSTTDSLDPGTIENDFSAGTVFNYGNFLTEVDASGKLRPELAESYDSTDAKTWVFKLRKGVEFHNGKTMDADDVIASLNHHRGEASKSAAKGILSGVTDIRKDGDDVVFELDAPNADFPFLISDYHLVIMPGKDGKIDPLSGIGTGGYVLNKFEPGVRAEFTRNPNYWKENAAFFDEVQLLSIVDITARQTALINGDVDAIGRVDPKTVALLARNPNINILEKSGTAHYTFPMRLDVEPFGNYDLRMALKHAIKRQELVDKILLGHGALGNDVPVSPSMPFFAELPQREFDPEKAAEHYKKSGHSGTIQLSASDAAFAGAVDAAQLIAASAKEAGIDIEVVREPSDGYWSNVWNKKGWCACYWSGRPTIDWMYASAYVDSTEWNDTAWKTTDAAKKFNMLTKAAKGELDETKRAEMYKETQMLLADDGGAIIPLFNNYINGLSKKLSTGENVAANWDLDGGRSAERWWFNS
ncbi:ABC transporter substrate-binding protein [Pseudahrensia aquimaris]|uniref:ABC transporter substrate-binding protein n=1 Tax=Pseudahrensia aquimaris TaxID=744461 RepID=A0ABW3FAI6_9HYPH